MINFNELFIEELVQYLDANSVWFVDGSIDIPELREVLKGYFEQHKEPVPALLRKK